MRFQSQFPAASARHRRLRLFTASVLALTSALTASSQAQTLSAKVKAQIADVLSVKDTFTPAEQKMDSRLVFAQRKALGQNIGTAAQSLVNASSTDVVEVEIASSFKTPAALSRSVTAYGGNVLSVKSTTVGNKGRIHATVPLTSLSNIANDPSVASIRPVPHALPSVGALTSQGYVVESASTVVNSMGITGAGITVGVLSDSASQARVNALKASGDLNANAYVLVPYDDGMGGDLATDEGAAIMEIVQDMAPSATVVFATAYNTPTEFADNILSLAIAGAQIIVDDVGYSGEGPFQDDVIARAVDAVTDLGVLYVSSAGNSGSVTHGTSGTWEGDFVSGGTYTPPAGSGSTKTYNVAKIGAVNYDQVKLIGEPYIDMEWSDQLGHSANDYDFFVTNSAGTTLKGFSVTVQNGMQDPVEELDETAIGGNYKNAAAGDLLVITQTTGAAARFLRIDMNRGELATTFTDGSTAGHSAAANTFCTAAAFWNTADRGVKPLTATGTAVETFSSDGPRHIFYQPNGTPITPGNFSSTGGQVLMKPDATGADGVSTTTPGFSPFFGTSAAGPHVAGIAALALSANLGLSNVQLRNILTSTAIDNEAAGFDVNGGYGVLDALTAVNAALAAPY